MNMTYLMFAVYLCGRTYRRGIYNYPGRLWKYETLFTGWTLNRVDGRLVRVKNETD